jgi:hypothetical protein
MPGHHHDRHTGKPVFGFGQGPQPLLVWAVVLKANSEGVASLQGSKDPRCLTQSQRAIHLGQTAAEVGQTRACPKINPQKVPRCHVTLTADPGMRSDGSAWDRGTARRLGNNRPGKLAEGTTMLNVQTNEADDADASTSQVIVNFTARFSCGRIRRVKLVFVQITHYAESP